MNTIIVLIICINSVFTAVPEARFRREVQTGDTIRPSLKACQTYSQLPNNETDAEGVSFKYPWMAALGYVDLKRQIQDYFCGGSIISEYFVLTTALCARSREPPVFVRLGKASLSDEDGVPHVDYRIQEIIKHPKYSLLSQKNDVALIRVTERIHFTNNIQPACLHTDTRDESPDVHLFVTGWGSVSRDRYIRSNEIQNFELETVSLTECNSTLYTYNNLLLNQSTLRQGLHEGQYCAKDPKQASQPCQGNGGSPLHFFVNNSTRPNIIGMWSFGVGCRIDLPGVFTRVAHFLDWIEPIVWPVVNTPSA